MRRVASRRAIVVYNDKHSGKASFWNDKMIVIKKVRSWFFRTGVKRNRRVK